MKAVAIEHEKDADAAAEVVLTDILPFWTENPVTPASTSVDRDQSTSVVVTPVSPSVNQRASTVASSDPTVICPSDEDLGGIMLLLQYLQKLIQILRIYVNIYP